MSQIQLQIHTAVEDAHRGQMQIVRVLCWAMCIGFHNSKASVCLTMWWWGGGGGGKGGHGWWGWVQAWGAAMGGGGGVVGFALQIGLQGARNT